MNKKASCKAFKEKELVDFKTSLPMEETKFPPLFDFLDEQLEENGCRHDLSLVQRYCKENNIDFAILSEWCEKYGGHCDCEVLANVEDEFYYLEKIVPTEILQKTKTIQREKLNNLSTGFGFAIKQVPHPWILLKITEKNEARYQFQIGKKSDCPMLLKNDLSVIKLAEDNFLQDYWTQQTELDNDIVFRIERRVLLDFEIVQVRTERWMPIFTFIYHLNYKWHLEMTTTTLRVKSDMKELERLLKEVLI